MSRVYEDGPPYDVQKYIYLTRDGYRYRDSSRFLAIKKYRTPGHCPSTYVPTDVDEVWRIRWLHAGGRLAGGTDTTTTGPFDSPYIRCWEEVHYVRRLEVYVKVLMSSTTEGKEFTVNDRFMIPGRYEHLYFLNRNYWGKDFSDESRIRETDGVFWGWNQTEYHNMLKRDRKDWYAPLPEDWKTMFNGARLLGIPTPWVAVYAQNLMISSMSWVKKDLYDVAKMEYTLFFTLCHAQAALEGVHVKSNQSADFRLHEYEENMSLNGRLFNVPPGVVEILACVHPFYFLETSGFDPVLTFLALRRGQEIIIEGGGVQ